jgi:hypothetical protein
MMSGAMGSLDLLFEFLWRYVAGFWFFVFSRDFRGRCFEVWRSRSGVGHLRTAFEVSIAGVTGLIPLWFPLSYVFLVAR